MDRNWIFPPDVAQDIMSRLPVRDLLRMRCVSKEWRALIDDTSFIKKHYQVQSSLCKSDSYVTHIIRQIKPTPPLLKDVLLLSIHQENVFTLNLRADIDRDSKALLPFPYGKYEFDIDCHGCVNGIVCLSFTRSSRPKIKRCFLGLWNPATREFKTVTYPNVPGLRFSRFFVIHGFGYDLVSNDFKIVSTTHMEGKFSYRAIYSLKSNSWKLTYDHCHVPEATSDGYLNGVYYWTTHFPEQLEPLWRFDIVSFNFTTEKFMISDGPEEAVALVSRGNAHQAMMGVYKEQLVLIISHEVEVGSCNINVWGVTQFDECGVPLSWQPLFTIQSTAEQSNLEVRTILLNGDFLLTGVVPGDDLPVVGPYDYDPDDFCSVYDYQYNLSRDEFKKLDIVVWDSFGYVESLFPITRPSV